MSERGSAIAQAAESEAPATDSGGASIMNEARRVRSGLKVTSGWHPSLRDRFLVRWGRLRSSEFWPTWAYYLPIWPMWVRRLLLPGGPLVFTCVNPGVANGGGFIGESKSAILHALPGDPRILAHALIGPGGSPQQRAARAQEAINTRPELGGFPVIAKPDDGERGLSVRIVRTAADLLAYFETNPDPIVLQRFDPGPSEFGVFWVRRPETIGSPPPPGQRAGAIGAITVKTFAEVIGDGRRSVRELIYADKWFRCHARVYLERLGERAGDIPAADEAVGLGRVGNHLQGCMFSDGEGLITPELEDAIDRLASGFAGGFDYGRFDVMCAGPEALGRGEFAVIELNGVTAEPSNMYDPDWSCWRRWRVLRSFWKQLYALGDARHASGVRPISFGEGYRLWQGSKRRTRVVSG